MIQIREGMRVKRGPTWDYGNQDGGRGGEGTVEYLDHGSWWRVAWDAGGNDVYCVDDSHQDIIPIDQKAAREAEEAKQACSCGGPSKMVDVMNMTIEMCTECNKRK
jgi:hypothetical protein